MLQNETIMVKFRNIITALAASFLAVMVSCSVSKNTEVSDNHKRENLESNARKACYPKKRGTLRIMSYNVGAFSKYMTNSTSMIAAMIKEAEADVVGLNELDSCNARHNVNQVHALADALGGWQWHFGRAMGYRGGAYGNGVVVPRESKVIASYVVTLPKGAGSEQRSVAVVETEDYVLGAGHLDHKSEDAVLAQIAVVDAWAKENYYGVKKPVFFIGDMNSKPSSKAINALSQSWNILSSTEPSFPNVDPVNCIDYVFHYKHSALVRVVNAHTMTEFHDGDVAKASDHLPIYVDVVIK